MFCAVTVIGNVVFRFIYNIFLLNLVSNTTHHKLRSKNSIEKQKMNKNILSYGKVLEILQTIKAVLKTKK